MNKLVSSALFLLISYAALFIVQLWFNVFSDSVFLKLTITFGVILATLSVIIFLKNYLHEEEKLKQDKFVD